MKTRILRFSTDNGEKEYVVFTEDLKMTPESYQRPNYELDGDDIIDAEMPSGFPLDNSLDRH